MWNSPAEFFAMGGYALYVWSSFGVCAAVLLWEPMSIRVCKKAIIRRLQQERLAEQFDQESSQ
ncbi:heme exporter protein CcmD [Polynucleobacter sp. AP-Sanab-80-C2]|jgi:heme exporter protein D|uniref:heme exporter protein CcmD n=1 Tax=unclassified Polynucleobacter TaxID=2640945 RepID=UPI001BFDBE18|nr:MULTISPECIES: heme exporter protein CcmD [unclassified Polynucleobacter]MBU3632616.1 heme exporter protein CcmD [Polynucleobacter sp. AP-Feld-500C-C5]MEA9599564.1 heme exporter protein CcmD [Polynucleobacter sp. AP-Sanab-80-C2]QWE06149.1 heme exporter protein CcmD [Polynucleobacter sp. JS-JIR-5-A7]